jgi:type 1 glutamine amidotransferase
MTRALFMYGGWEGHEPDICAVIVAPALRASGLDLTLSQDLELYANVDGLRQYDVIVHCWSFDVITPRQEQGL